MQPAIIGDAIEPLSPSSMGSRSARRICLAASSLFFFYIILFSFTGNAFNYSSRELKNVPLDNMVWRFIYGVRDCLRRETELFEYAKKPFQEYWRRLPAISDACGVNPQMSIRSYSTSGRFNFYFVPNMNKTVAGESCRMAEVSVEKFKEVDEKLKNENPNCAVTPFKTASKLLASSSSLRVNALFVQLSHQQTRQLLEKLSSSDLPICQVNLLYPEPSARREAEFVTDFNRLLTEGKYLLLKAEKDFTSTFMNFFLVNFSDDYCRNRYFRMYTFD